MPVTAHSRIALLIHEEYLPILLMDAGTLESAELWSTSLTLGKCGNSFFIGRHNLSGHFYIFQPNLFMSLSNHPFLVNGLVSFISVDPLLKSSCRFHAVWCSMMLSIRACFLLISSICKCNSHNFSVWRGTAKLEGISFSFTILWIKDMFSP